MKRKPLTPKQQIVFAYLQRYQVEQDRMPSTREIQAHLLLASQTSAVNYLTHLERKGWITRLRYEARAITLLA